MLQLSVQYNMAEIDSEPVTMAEGSMSKEESNHSSSCLSLHYSSPSGSTSDVSIDDNSDHDSEADFQRIEPYM